MKIFKQTLEEYKDFSVKDRRGFEICRKNVEKMFCKVLICSENLNPVGTTKAAIRHIFLATYKYVNILQFSNRSIEHSFRNAALLFISHYFPKRNKDWQ